MNSLILFGSKYLYIIIIFIAVTFAVFFLNKDKKFEILKLSVITLPIAFILLKITSKLYFDPRPFMVEHVQPLIPHAADNGFPSDHTLLTMTIASIVYIYNKTLGIILAVLALAVGVSRVLAKVHHPLDILGSIIIAIIATAVSKYLLKHFSKTAQSPQISTSD